MFGVTNMKKMLLSLSVTAALAGCGGGETLEDVKNETATVVPMATVSFDPANGVISVPNDLLMSGTQDGTINQSFAGDLNDRNNWIWSFSTMGTTQSIEYFIYSKRALDRTAGRIPKDVIARLSSADEIVVSIEYKGKQAPANLKGRLMVKAGGYK